MARLVVKTSHPLHPTRQQYGIWLYGTKGRRLKRIPGCFPSSRSHQFKDETDEFQNAAEKKIAIISAEAGREGNPNPSGRYRTCSQAIDAYECWHGRKCRSNKRNFHYHCKHFKDYFKDILIRKLDVKSAEEYIFHLIGKGYAFDTVRLSVVAASGMVEFLRSEGEWSAPNPFNGLLKNHTSHLRKGSPGPTRFEDEEWSVIEGYISDPSYRAARIFSIVSRLTGLRPSEVMALDTETMDRKTMTWRITVTKKTGAPVQRKIAIPKSLVEFIGGEHIHGPLPISETTVKRQLSRLKDATGINIQPRRFRKDFACRMEEAGATDSVINLHQGRGQTGVLHKHYLDYPDRAARICRPYIEQLADALPWPPASRELLEAMDISRDDSESDSFNENRPKCRETEI